MSAGTGAISGGADSSMGVGPVTRNVRSRSLGPAAGVQSAGYQLGRMGSVQQMVARFNLGRPLPAIPNMSALDSTARRHGRAERGSGRRERSPRPHSWRSGRTTVETQTEWRHGQTDYDRRQARAARAIERQLEVDKLGPESRSDFDSIIGSIYDRLDACERYGRLHAGTLASHDGRLTAIADDFDEYKDFITSTHTTIDDYIKRQIGEVRDAHQTPVAQLESLASLVTPKVEGMDQRLRILEDLVNARPGRVPQSPTAEAPSPMPALRNPENLPATPAGFGGLGAPAPAAGAPPQFF